MQERSAAGLLRRPSALTDQQMEMARAQHGCYARSLSLALTACLRTDVSAQPAGLEQITYHEFTGALDPAGYSGAFGLPVTDSSGVLSLSAPLVFPVLEVLLGAPAAMGSIDRPLTEIEHTLLEGFAKILLAGLEETWGEKAETDLRLRAFATQAEAERAVPMDEVVIEMGTRLSISDIEGLVRLALPALLLGGAEPAPAEAAHASPEQQRRILELIKPATMDLEVLLEGSGMRMRDLAALRPGSILRFDHGVQHPLACRVNGATELAGNVVRSGKKRAFIVGDPAETA